MKKSILVLITIFCFQLCYNTADASYIRRAESHIIGYNPDTHCWAVLVMILDENNYVLCYDKVTICGGCMYYFPPASETEGYLQDSMAANPMTASAANTELGILCNEKLDWPNNAPLNRDNENSKQEIELNVYPNPSNGTLYIKNKNLHGSYIFIIENITGQRVKQVNFSNSSELISISDLAPGNYIYRAILPDQIISGTFIKQ